MEKWMRRFSSKFISVIFIFSLSIQVGYAQLPEHYQTLPAEEKRDLLWSEINKSHNEEPLPPLSGSSFMDLLHKLKGLFNLSPAFDHVSDELPEGRLKIIHTNGTVGKIAFVPVAGHPFTGIYNTGAIGLARLSLAMPSSNESYIPGMAVKFLIHGHPSLNLHTINQLEGQGGNWNFFAKDFSNRIPHPTGWVLSAIEKIFEWTRDPANDLSLWQLAAWTPEGQYQGIPVYPERIYFKPSIAVKDLIPEDSREDFRISLLKVAYGPIYDMYGEYQGNEYQIGTLMLESSLLASNYGDQVLFFQHLR